MENETQLPPPQPPRARHFWLGIGLGSIPLVLALIAIGTLSSVGSGLLVIALVFYVAVLIAAIVCLIIRNVRYIGYGLLTMVCATPIVAAVACIVLLTALSPHS